MTRVWMRNGARCRRRRGPAGRPRSRRAREMTLTTFDSLFGFEISRPRNTRRRNESEISRADPLPSRAITVARDAVGEEKAKGRLAAALRRANASWSFSRAGSHGTRQGGVPKSRRECSRPACSPARTSPAIAGAAWRGSHSSSEPHRHPAGAVGRLLAGCRYHPVRNAGREELCALDRVTARRGDMELDGEHAGTARDHARVRLHLVDQQARRRADVGNVCGGCTRSELRAAVRGRRRSSRACGGDHGRRDRCP